MKEFLNPRGYFHREPYYLLSQDLKEIRTYFSILNAIAFGNTRPTNIANFIGLETRMIYPYLETLQRLEFIRREVPIGGNPKRGIYFISDPMIYSWFNIVYKKRHEIESDIFTLNSNDIQFFSRSFENLAREFLLRVNANRGLGIKQLGRWWHKGEEIDIVGINPEKKLAYFFEVKYQTVNERKCTRILNRLKRKAVLTPFSSEEWENVFGVVAKKITKKAYTEREEHLMFDIDDIIAITRE
jgi:AAA+ ATPase superfamily predicted ATPase